VQARLFPQRLPHAATLEYTGLCIRRGSPGRLLRLPEPRPRPVGPRYRRHRRQGYAGRS
jgi:hypothetical protein